MHSNTMRVVLGIAAIAVAVVLLIVLEGNGGDDGGNGGGAGTAVSGNGGGDSDSSGGGNGADEVQGAALAVPTVVVKNGKPVGGPRTLTYIKGDQIRFQVDSDVSDEVHVHGYNLTEDVKGGGSVRFDFPAKLEGIFEVELEDAKRQIAELRVGP